MKERAVSADHRLVVLGSMDEFVKLVKMAQDRGIYVIVCDGYANGPAKLIADKSYDIDVRDVDAVAKMCREERADGIISSFSDVLAENLVAIAERAGLPTYLDSDRLRYLRDKTMMKAMFDELGVPYPKSAVVRRESAIEDLSGLSFPCVVKPIDAYGSHGIHVLDSPEEIASYFEESASYSKADCILAEEYNHGFEFNMMNWVVDGEPVVLEIADREKTTEIAHTTPHVSRIVYPSRLTNLVIDEAREIVSKVARYVGMVDGPLCMQFFWSERRGLQVCECAGRIFGYEHELLELACGLSIEEVLLDYVYDRDRIRERLRGHSPYLDRISAGLYFHGYEGRICRIEGLDEASERPEVKEILSYYAPGDEIRHGVGDKPYVIRIYLSADSYKELDQVTDCLYRSIKVLSQDGSNLLYGSELTSYDELAR